MTTVLGLITIALILIIVFQISKVADTASAIRGDEKAIDGSNKINSLLFLIFMPLFFIGVLWSSVHYAPLYLPESSSVHGVWIRDMLFWTFAATVPVFVLTHIALFYFSYKYKGEKGKRAYYYPENHKLELIWTVIPSIVLILLVFMGIVNWYKITSPAPNNALVIEATGKQFMWTLRYAGKDNKLGVKSIMEIKDDNPLGQKWTDDANKDDFIADELHLPVGVPILIKINSMDVLHNFYLPHFTVKMDAVPGIPTQFWFTATKTTEQMKQQTGNPNFTYELACAELCGSAHFNMRKVVVVEDKATFDKWFAEQKPTYAQLQEQKQNAAPAGNTPNEQATPATEPAATPQEQQKQKHSAPAKPHATSVKKVKQTKTLSSL